ncbi:centrosomal protein CCDC61-like [Chrysoperla carnea]|uniref:centrosomal protein CCDC61-like n=1 Tax=Chrysoperla carnea TaxID=189513 RepID=UPI001D0633A3|nr:centrosomal protein CCDC61-like [Chrysoperla carnea]
MADHHLVTTCCFKGREYLVKMNIVNNTLIDITITDKYSGEDWQCNYDAAYIESLTQRTGNFKQFNIFITMLKSGLLKTSDCVSLDLLTFEDLEILRSRKGKPFCPSGYSANGKFSTNNNRRYLILTYSVEFDRIHYPLPLDYCGPPDPQILQANIRRLENEICRLQEIIAGNASESINMSKYQQTINSLTEENNNLKSEINHLRNSKNSSTNKMEFLHEAIKTLEESQQILTLQEKFKYSIESHRRKISPHQSLRFSDPGLNLLFFNPNSKNDPSSKTIDKGKKSFNTVDPIIPQVSRIESWETTLRSHNIIEPPRRRPRSASKSSPSCRRKSAVEQTCEPVKQSKRKSRKDQSRQRNRSRSTSQSRTRASSTESITRQSTNNFKHIQQSYQAMRMDSVRKLHPMESTASEDCQNLALRIQALQKMISESTI